MAQPWMADAGEDNANIEKFLKGMGDYKAPIPDTVITHILAEAGLSTSDPRVHRTLNVACQKFIFDVITDCSTCAELRIKRTKGKAKKEKDLLVSDLKTALEAKVTPAVITHARKTGIYLEREETPASAR